MRVPIACNPRIQKRILKRFGVYTKVYPEETTPSRIVPEHIQRPNYESLVVPSIPEIKNADQIRGMQISCKLAANILQKLGQFIQPGVTTDAIDEVAHNLSIEAGAYPSPLLYKGFPKSVCTSVNNVVVHGIPDLRPLEDGDIVNVDITVFFKGFHGDCSKTFLVGDAVDDRGLQLVRVTEECLDVLIKKPKIDSGRGKKVLPSTATVDMIQQRKYAIKGCGPGVPFSEIGNKIYKHAKRHGLTVIPCVLGHGIGEYFHGPPEVRHSKNKYAGKMQPGMTFTIEPAITHGSVFTVLQEDGWTLLTQDGSRCAQAEHTVLITEGGAEILTKD